LEIVAKEREEGQLMPFREIKSIDEATRRSMSQAFDAACDRLRLEPDDPERGELAAVIIELVAAGERDPARLFALTVETMDLGE
jgi:hypothetical protein